MEESVTFKGTRGDWFIDPKSGMIKCKTENGIESIATAWKQSTEHLDERLDGESWLSMRERTKKERERLDEEVPKANAKLMSASLVMLEAIVHLFQEDELINLSDKTQDLLIAAVEKALD